MPQVYDELRALAASCLDLERPDHTLQPTALVHEAYVRLLDGRQRSWTSRAHFFAVAARVIRHVLVDHARRRKSARRQGARSKISLDECLLAADRRDVDLLAVDEAIARLTTLHGRPGRVVELRFFGGLGVAEVACVLGVSRKTADKDWSFARAWLSRELSEEGRDEH